MIAVNVKLKGLFPSEMLKQKLKTLRLLEEIWGGLRERPCPKPALLPQVARLPADLPSQANQLNAAFFCQHPKMPHFSNGGTSFFKKMSWSSKDDNHPMIPSLFKSKVIEVFVGLDNVKGQRVRFELRPPPNCTELSQQYLPGEGL